MARKNLIDLEDDDLVLDRKAKRKLARSLEKQKQEQERQREETRAEEEQPPAPAPPDAMSRVAMLCQENRWREALALCRSVLAESPDPESDDVACGVRMAMGKIERSLRRQMAAAFLVSSNEALRKEYPLDAGKQ